MFSSSLHGHIRVSLRLMLSRSHSRALLLKTCCLPVCLFLAGCKRAPDVAPHGHADTVSVGRADLRNPELPARPAPEIQTPAQKAFWDYIETFNRLPDKPTEVQRQMLATKGEVKAFKFISTSPQSVFADVAGIKAHRERFEQRYLWVRSLLDKEHITLEVDEVLFSGTAAEIVKKHFEKVGDFRGNYYQPKGDRALYAQHWLESLLAVDYIVACGTKQDRVDAFQLLDQMLCAVAVSATDRAARATELEVPVITDIIMPIANALPEHCPERVVSFLGLLLRSTESPALYVDCMKWSLRVKEFAKWPELTRLHRVFAGNHYVNQCLPHYTVFWYHLHDGARPDKGSSEMAVQALFTVLYGKQEGPKEHKKYLDLLNAAYPLASKPPVPKPPATAPKK